MSIDLTAAIEAARDALDRHTEQRMGLVLGYPERDDYVSAVMEAAAPLIAVAVRADIEAESVERVTDRIAEYTDTILPGSSLDTEEVRSALEQAAAFVRGEV